MANITNKLSMIKNKKADTTEMIDVIEKADKSDKTNKADKSNVFKKLKKADKTDKANKSDKSNKPEKVNKVKKADNTDDADITNKKKKKVRVFASIRTKILISCLIPVIFMVGVGYFSYAQSADGLNNSFRENAAQTATMARNYLDNSLVYVKAQAMSYAFDKDIETYCLGMPGQDAIAVNKVWQDTRAEIMVTQASNTFIDNIHIIAREGVNNISTSSPDKIAGFLKTFKSSLEERLGDKSKDRWDYAHPELDEQFKLDPSNIYLVYEFASSSKFGYVVIDVAKSAISGILDDIDFGDGSVIGFVSDFGDELVKTDAGVSEEPLFATQSFFTNEFTEENMSGISDVKYDGKDYIYLYCRSVESPVTFCALVPLSAVTANAEGIKSMTVTLVLIATAVALLVAIFITIGIQRNVRLISRGLGEVAEGDLTVSVKAKGHDEFQDLASSATDMVKKNKKLVSNLHDTSSSLEDSTKDVHYASENISKYSDDIAESIIRIGDGMTKQAEHAQECIVKTNELSDKFKEINNMIEAIEAMSASTDALIKKGTQIVAVLSEKADKSSKMAEDVKQSIVTLQEETATIESFVGTITDISGQTNLLSLNASIEAARAGEAGRGFSVVAEEIRKLADDSNTAAEEIKHNVSKINVKTTASVDSALNAKNMMATQVDAVKDVIDVFNDINVQLKKIFSELKNITEFAKTADTARNETISAVENISIIIDDTASQSKTVKEIADQLQTSVDKLNEVENTLSKSMGGLKEELTAFRV
ncbi:MAG: methyl-accepting chemotaxis protein [Lachnospiraceae bacterium]|nr:methyl-accepting chemotaxis protein [Lachnospiraceae bacterium]